MPTRRGKSYVYSVTVAAAAHKEIERVRKLAGWSEQVFGAVALSYGIRIIERHLTPEVFMPEQLIDALAKAGIEIARGEAKGGAE